MGIYFRLKNKTFIDGTDREKFFLRVLTISERGNYNQLINFQPSRRPHDE